MASAAKPLEKWTVSELKAELKSLGLDTKGLKADLIMRIEGARAQGEGGEPDSEPAEPQVGEPQAGAEENGESAEAENLDKTGEDGGGEQEGAEEEGGEGMEVQEEPAEGGQKVDDAPAPEGVAGAEDEKAGAKSEERAEGGRPGSGGPRGEDYGPPEWEAMQIPDGWRASPLLVVKGLPCGATGEELRAALEGAGVPVKSVAVAGGEREGSAIGYVRLTPPPLPWLAAASAPEAGANGVAKAGGDADAAAVKVEDGGKEGEGEAKGDGAQEGGEEKGAERREGAAGKEIEVQFDDGQKKGDIIQCARFYSRKLAMSPVSLGDRQLTVEASELRVTIFLGNLPAEWGSDEALREHMEQYGSVERCFTMRNKDGESKDYAFVEFTLPGDAAKCKDVLDKRASETFERLFSIKTRGGPHGDRQSHGSLAGRMGTEAVTRSSADKEVEPTQGGKAEKEGADGTVEAGKSEEQATQMPSEEPAAEAGVGEEAVKEKDATKGEADEERSEKEDGAQEAKAGGAECTAEQDNAVKAESTASTPHPVRSEVREKILRPEWSTNRTVASMFGRTLYVANLPLQDDDGVLKRIFGQYGPILSCNFGKTKITGYGKGFGFIEFSRSDHADAALRALDRVEHPELGCLLITFVNPSKTDSEQRARQYNRKWTPPPQRYGTYAGGRGGGGGRGGPPGSRMYNVPPSRGGRGMATHSYGYGSQMQPQAYGMGGRVQPGAANKGPTSNVMAMAIAQQQINAVRAQQQLQLQHMRMHFQRQTMQMQTQYQNQLLQAQRQSQQAIEQLNAEKKATQQAVAAAQAQQQAAAVAAANKSSQQASVQHRAAPQAVGSAQAMSQQRQPATYGGVAVAGGQQNRTARPGTQPAAGYGSQGYMYAGQQATQQLQTQQQQQAQQQAAPQAQVQTQAQAQAYGQQGYYQAGAYTQPSTYSQQTMYQQPYGAATSQQTQQAYGTQTATGYGNQPGYQSGYGTAQQQQQQQQQQYAAAYAAQAQPQAGYGTSQATYGAAAQSGYGATQQAYSQAGYGQSAYGQAQAQVAGQQAVGQKRDGAASQYQAGYGYDAAQAGQDYKRQRY